MDVVPYIVAVKRHSLEDGPGIRSVVFFKGCPLRCVFCQNPETQDPRPEIAFYEERCLRCGQCAAVCPRVIEAAYAGMCAAACPGDVLLTVESRGRLHGTITRVGQLGQVPVPASC